MKECAMRRVYCILGIELALGAALFAGSQLAWGQDEASSKKLIAPAIEAIDNGLAYLSRGQNNDGSFGTGQHHGNIAITSLAGLAFMAGGHQPGRGRYGNAV